MSLSNFLLKHELLSSPCINDVILVRLSLQTQTCCRYTHLKESHMWMIPTIFDPVVNFLSTILPACQNMCARQTLHCSIGYVATGHFAVSF
jgi:hypothetical protein